MNILKELNSIFCTVFDDENLIITINTTINDIDGWDSLSNLNLIIAVERKFKIKFGNYNFMWDNVNQIYNDINKLLY